MSKAFLRSTKPFNPYFLSSIEWRIVSIAEVIACTQENLLRKPNCLDTKRLHFGINLNMRMCIIFSKILLEIFSKLKGRKLFGSVSFHVLYNDFTFAILQMSGKTPAIKPWLKQKFKNGNIIGAQNLTILILMPSWPSDVLFLNFSITIETSASSVGWKKKIFFC